MTFGLQLTNGADELTLHTEAFHYTYFGKATLQTIVQTSSTSSGGGPYAPTVTDTFAGYSTYTYPNTGQPIVVAVGVPNGGCAVVRSCVYSSGTWTITVFCTATDASASFPIQVAADVYVFSRDLTVPTWGFALYNNAGSPLGNFSKRPLAFKNRCMYDASTTDYVACAANSKPAVIGMPWFFQSVGGGSSMSLRQGGWRWDATNARLYRNPIQLRYLTISSGSLGGSSGVQRNATNALLLDATGLT